MRALLVENHEQLSDALKRGLESQGFAVDLANNGVEASRKVGDALYDVIVLDLMLPRLDGLKLLQRAYRDNAGTRILVLACKPGAATEIERALGAPESVLYVHDLEINTSGLTAKRAGRSIYLTPREFALLHYLALHRGKVVTRAMIWEHVFHREGEIASNNVDVCIRNLRGKVDKGFGKRLILTCWGHGYRLRGDDE